MRILVTGAKGFLGSNLTAELKNRGYKDVFECDKDTDEAELMGYLASCEFVFHLAGVNRPEKIEEYMEGNYNFTAALLKELGKREQKVPVLITSSIQAELDNAYGASKKAAEAALRDYGAETGSRVWIYRLPNAFGKWCRPNYNSVVATFCHNAARGLPVRIDDTGKELQLAYVDDIVDEFIGCLSGRNAEPAEEYAQIPCVYHITLGQLAEQIQLFRDNRDSFYVSNLGEPFQKKLYSTFLSYLPEQEFSYPLKMNRDDRGSFTELFKTAEYGQVSVNISKAGITKGDHWHHTKTEKFIVVSGKALIRFRRVGSAQVTEYYVSGEKLEVVDIPPGYTHSITNIGEGDLITVMWANETFDPEKPDTYYEKV